MNMQWQNLVRVGIGAGLGAAARYLMPGPLLVVNVLGCLAFGLSKPTLFWRTGFLGGFTSFSAYILLAHPYLESARPSAFVLFILGHALACVAAVLAGRLVRRALERHKLGQAAT